MTRICRPARDVCTTVVDGAGLATRLGVGAAWSLPTTLLDQGRGFLDEFDLRGSSSPRSRVRLAMEAVADEALLTAFRLSVVDRPPHVVDAVVAEVAEAEEYFTSRGWIDAPVSYFPEPPDLVDPDLRRDRVGRLQIERLSFVSEYLPHDGEPGRERWRRYEHNDVAHAWVIRHRGEDRPWLVCHHGASMGWALADLAVFRAARLHRDLGLNLVFPVLPFHGPRGVRFPLALQLPVDDPVDTVHTFAQAVWDTRRLLSWIRRQSEAPIAVLGLSLGTHGASLVSALDDELAGVMVGVPAASLSDLYVDHMPERLRERKELEQFVASSRRLLSVVSPLAVTPLVPRRHRFIYAATEDRVTPAGTQAERLWQHWGEPEILWFNGGHIGVAWSAEVVDFITKALDTCGLGTNRSDVEATR